MASLHSRVLRDGSTSWRLHYRDRGRQQVLTFVDPAEADHWLGVFNAAGVESALRLIQQTLGPDPGSDVASVPTVREIVEAWKEDEEGRRYIGPPKSTAGKRSVEYGDTLEPILQKLVQERPGNQLLLVNRAGNPILNNSFHSRGWGLAVKKAQALGLSKSPRPHDLRHTFASWALASGEVNIFMLAVIMGHDDSMVTQKRYGHLMPSSQTAIAQAVGNRMARAASLPQRPAVAAAAH